MRYYTFKNPNYKSGQIKWGGGVLGDEPGGKLGDKLEALHEKKWLKMDGDEIGGHACCKDKNRIQYPRFKEVAADGPDGKAWWNQWELDQEENRKKNVKALENQALFTKGV